MSRTQIEITLGILLVLVTGTFLVIYGLNEPVRMEQLALEQHGRRPRGEHRAEQQLHGLPRPAG